MNTSNQKTKELVRAGHEFAAAMSNDTPIIEIAKLVSRLASALDVQSVLVQQLAAEGAMMKTAINQTIGWQRSVDAENIESVRLLVALETPFTDTSIFQLRAEGVELFAKTMHADISQADAIEFARQLREGNKTGRCMENNYPGGYDSLTIRQLLDDLVTSHISKAMSSERMGKAEKEADLRFIHGVIVSAAHFVRSAIDEREGNYLIGNNTADMYRKSVECSGEASA